MNEDKKIKVLIIEDDSYISDMYKIKFDSENFETIIARDGMEGIKFLEKEVPDIILLDIVMPQVDGFSVLKTIKKDKRLARVPVILLTNLSQKENVERGFELGANGYIIKAHFTPSEVVKKIKEILEKQSM
jgi:DNA-binding response OmpR family regulator